MTRSAPRHLVIDNMIPFAREAFARLGDVTLLPGHAITRETLRHAHALIVRSGTRVDAALLDDCPVAFVGAATTGVDHIDQRYLASRHIEFASAPGCNADAVAEYVLTALLVTARARDIDLRGRTIGIVGVGRIGGRVARMTRALGMRPILHDPPLARATGHPQYRPLAEALRADVLTLHVPLTVEGPDPTRHLIGRDELARMASTAMLINTSRGAVVDNDALLAALAGRVIGGAALDVWEGEPSVNWNLLSRVMLGTPHIAGHSFDGKVNGTVMIYHACCRFRGLTPTWQPPATPAEPRFPASSRTSGASDSSRIVGASDSSRTAGAAFPHDATGKDVQEIAHDLATTLYDLHGDHARMMGILALPESRRPAAFDQLRRDYPQRREFSASPVTIKGASEEIIQIINALGIQARSI